MRNCSGGTCYVYCSLSKFLGRLPEKQNGQPQHRKSAPFQDSKRLLAYPLFPSWLLSMYRKGMQMCVFLVQLEKTTWYYMVLMSTAELFTMPKDPPSQCERYHFQVLTPICALLIFRAWVQIAKGKADPKARHPQNYIHSGNSRNQPAISSLGYQLPLMPVNPPT